MIILKVVWLDAQHSAGEWVTLDAMKGPLPEITSAGLLVHEDRAKIVLAAAWDGHHATAEITTPRSAIVKMRVMR